MDPPPEQKARFPETLENQLDQTLTLKEHPSVATRVLTENERPFVFFEVSEIGKLIGMTFPKNVVRLKSCGIVQYDGDVTRLRQPFGEADEFGSIELVDTESLGALPLPGKLIEVFGYVRPERTDGKVKFSVWFWRERLGNYNALAALYKGLRERFCE